MENIAWREEALKKLREVLEADEAVISLSLFGSLSKGEIEKDKWSDIDILLVVKNGSLNRFYPPTDWLKEIGDIFAFEQNGDEIHASVKVIFTDFRKIDIVLTTQSNASQELAHLQDQQVIFSKDENVKALLHNPPKASLFDPDSAPFEKLVNDFWFLSFMAVTKLIRNDVLIGLHLAVELYKNCLVLGMMLRDRDLRRNIHRTGGLRNDLPEKMNIKLLGSSKQEILSFIEHCGKEFDTLALEWSSSYREHSSSFKKALDLAKQDM